VLTHSILPHAFEEQVSGGFHVLTTGQKELPMSRPLTSLSMSEDNAHMTAFAVKSVTIRVPRIQGNAIHLLRGLFVLLDRQPKTVLLYHSQAHTQQPTVLSRIPVLRQFQLEFGRFMTPKLLLCAQ
jgi:hypothetical protein